MSLSRISLRHLRTATIRVVRPSIRLASSAATSADPNEEDVSTRLQTQLNNDLLDSPSPLVTDSPGAIDWSRSFHGLSTTPFESDVADILMADLDSDSIEIKPDGLLYLPEIKYRRILNKAFGPGGWGLAPRGETYVTEKSVSREYALICHGRLVSVARGEQDYFGPEGIATATEGCKSNALMRCCKDLGIASELWDPTFIRAWKRDNCVEQFVEHVVTKKKRKLCKGSMVSLYDSDTDMIQGGEKILRLNTLTKSRNFRKFTLWDLRYAEPLTSNKINTL